MRNDKSFGRYVMEAYPGLIRRAVLLMGGRANAEDLVQASLTSAYQRWSRVEEPNAYLRTVMIRTAIGWKTRKWRGEIPTEHLPEIRLNGDASTDLDMSAAVRRALMSLPREQRAVVVLRYFDDCTEAEIAFALGCSPGTVKSRASRALAALRDSGLLAEEGQIR